MIELQILIDRWKQEAANIENWNQQQYDQCLYFENKGNLLRLRKCIGEVELLLLKDESKQPQPPISQTPRSLGPQSLTP